MAESTDCDTRSKCLRSLRASIQNLQNRIDEIRANRVNLLLEEMISNEEYYAFCELRFYLEKIKNEAANGNIRGVVDELTEFLQHGEEIFEQMNCGIRLNDIEYTTDEFWNFMKATEGKTYVKRMANTV